MPIVVCPEKIIWKCMMSKKTLSLHEEKRSESQFFSFSIFHVFPPIVERNGAREGCQKIGNLMEGASGTDLTQINLASDFHIKYIAWCKHCPREI